MTEERKQELRQLLQKAMKGLQIGIRFGGDYLVIPVVDWKNYLQRRWTSYGVDSSSVLMYLEPYIASEITKFELLEFIREELAPFIHEDEVTSASYAITDEDDGGFRLHDLKGGRVHLNVLLEHLLKIAIAWGVEKAVSTFGEGCYSKGKRGFFQTIASLEGIVVEKEIQVYEKVRLAPFPRSTTFELERYFPDFSIRGSGLAHNRGKTLLIIDLPMLSMFHKPLEKTFDERQINDLPFQVEVQDTKLSNLDVVDSVRTSFCQALSLACNSPVQIARTWWFLSEDEIFRPFSGGGMGYSPRLFGDSVKAGESEIEEAKYLHEILTNLNSKSQEKLEIAIDRWIKSKTYQKPVDKMIDLGIAFESLYVPAKVPGKRRHISANLQKNASRYLGKNKEDEKHLKKKFKVIYSCRCDAAHEGKLADKIEIEKDKHVSKSEFIEKVQNLCRDSIMKILKKGKFPDWNNLILGEVDS